MEILIPDTSRILVWLIESTITVSILICVIMAVRFVLGRKLPAWWIHGLWVLLIMRMLLPLNLETSLSVFNLVPKVSTGASYIPYLKENGLYMPFTQEIAPLDGGAVGINSSDEAFSAQITTEPVSVASSPGWRISFKSTLMFVWLSGVIVLALCITAKQFRFWRVVRNEPELVDSKVLELFASCKGMLEIRRNIPLIVTNKVKSPAIFGYLRPRLLIPPKVTHALQAQELSYVFLHELGHLKRHDIGVSWLAAFAQCLHWFNPLVWFAFYTMRSDQEAACDAFVLARLEQVRPQSYASTIVNLLENYGVNKPVQALAGIVENKSQLKRRIKMIINFKKYNPKETILSAMTLVSIGFVLFTNPLRADVVPDFSEMEEFKFHEARSFSIDIPDSWYARPADSQWDHQIARFASTEEARTHIVIWELGQMPEPVDAAPVDAAIGAQKSLSQSGAGNFVVTQRLVGAHEAAVLEFDGQNPKQPQEIQYHRQYFIGGEKGGYVVGIATFDESRLDELEPTVASLEFTIDTETD